LVSLLFRLEANTLSRLPDTKSHKNIDKWRCLAPSLIVLGDRLSAYPLLKLNFHLSVCLYVTVLATLILLSFNYYKIIFFFGRISEMMWNKAAGKRPRGVRQQQKNVSRFRRSLASSILHSLNNLHKAFASKPNHFPRIFSYSPVSFIFTNVELIKSSHFLSLFLTARPYQAGRKGCKFAIFKPGFFWRRLKRRI